MAVKKCALYIRVSTEEQAKVVEGSLKNQQQALEGFINSKKCLGGDTWEIIDVYIDEKTAKDTNRPAYQRMMEAVRCNKVNTILCTASSRIFRSVLDMLSTVDWFHKQKVDFICLKENFDTTTAHGKLALTIVAGLNQFERELTSERTRFNMLERAKRGLSQGCHITGYNLDPDRKGNLIPNKEEAKMVNLIFDTYLSCGSIITTYKIINKKGYTSKRFTSIKTAQEHGGKKFCYTSIHNILTNYAYIGKREINKMNKAKKAEEMPENQHYAICDAIWPPIVDEEKFKRTQAMMARNYKSKNNGTLPTKHSYLFNGDEVLYCHKCNSRMEGRNAHGKKNKTYYYYVCTNPDCRFRVPEIELEAVVQKIIVSVYAKQPMLNRITNRLNAKLVAQLPEMRLERQKTTEELNELSKQAKKIMDTYSGVENGKTFVEQYLTELDEKKSLIKNRLQALDVEIGRLESESIDETRVKGLLGTFDEIFKSNIKFYQKQMLLKWIAKSIKIGAEEVSIGIDSGRFRSDITQMLRHDMIPDIPQGSHINSGEAFSGFAFVL